MNVTLYRSVCMLVVAAVLLSPAIAAAATSNTTVQATVNSVISVSSEPVVTISVMPTSGGVMEVGDDTIVVDSNDPDGYNLSIENDATLTMAGPNGATIAKAPGTYSVPALLAANTWGYQLVGFQLDTFAGVEDTPQVIRSTTATAAGQPTYLTYAVKVDTSIPAGVYSDTVTYTATVK